MCYARQRSHPSEEWQVTLTSPSLSPAVCLSQRRGLFLGRNDADQGALLRAAWQSAGLSRTTEVFQSRRSSKPGDRAPGSSGIARCEINVPQGKPYSSFRDLNAPDPTGSKLLLQLRTETGDWDTLVLSCWPCIEI
jgi:hypothetical protein